jgi:hypothetical protein
MGYCNNQLMDGTDAMNKHKDNLKLVGQNMLNFRGWLFNNMDKVIKHYELDEIEGSYFYKLSFMNTKQFMHSFGEKSFSERLSDILKNFTEDTIKIHFDINRNIKMDNNEMEDKTFNMYMLYENIHTYVFENKSMFPGISTSKNNLEKYLINDVTDDFVTHLIKSKIIS